jgi:hypothetical protein
MPNFPDDLHRGSIAIATARRPSTNDSLDRF